MVKNSKNKIDDHVGPIQMFRALPIQYNLVTESSIKELIQHLGAHTLSTMWSTKNRDGARGTLGNVGIKWNIKGCRASHKKSEVEMTDYSLLMY